ncbi:hypothetical protein L6164_022230 [Bauhinia variegata]|uniref:Uncharacterized protein n=1 Tax=Bauhinia variegata TaxID=167791 RepID=A0ACB9MFW0_BAUVA|nr:hypothetical protein L6164_022230 [Bauhinia variegata]
MNPLCRCRKPVHRTLSRRIQHRICILRRCIIRLFDNFLVCSSKKASRYRALQHPSPSSSLSVPSSSADNSCELAQVPHVFQHELDSDLVALKITLLGDCQIGKTSFLVKYAGDENGHGGETKKGLNQVDKILNVRGARISYRIWEVEGDGKSQDQITMACQDSVAILIMFDLTSRCTLNSVIGWYKEARKRNQVAIPVLIGNKFDDFIQLPIDLQWTIASQARAYAKALSAPLFFSSATYNINEARFQ